MRKGGRVWSSGRRAGLSLAVWGGWLVAACAPSEDEVKHDFNIEVQRSNDCMEASECVAVAPGCPLGCWVLVNAKHKDRVEATARELIDDYESGGASCDFECAEVPEAACVAGKCAPAQ